MQLKFHVASKERYEDVISYKYQTPREETIGDIQPLYRHKHKHTLSHTHTHTYEAWGQVTRFEHSYALYHAFNIFGMCHGSALFENITVMSWCSWHLQIQFIIFLLNA